MIRSFQDMDRLASEKGPKRLVVLAPEDEEFMMAVKKSAEEGYTRPILIGDREKMERLADQVQYDISGTEKIYEKSRQAIADLGHLHALLRRGRHRRQGADPDGLHLPGHHPGGVEGRQGEGRQRRLHVGHRGPRPPDLLHRHGRQHHARLPGQGRDRAQCRLSLSPAGLPEAEDLRAVRQEGDQRRHPLLPGLSRAEKSRRCGRSRFLRGDGRPPPFSTSSPRGERPFAWATSTSERRTSPTSCSSPTSRRATSS